MRTFAIFRHRDIRCTRSRRLGSEEHRGRGRAWLRFRHVWLRVKPHNSRPEFLEILRTLAKKWFGGASFPTWHVGVFEKAGLRPIMYVFATWWTVTRPRGGGQALPFFLQSPYPQRAMSSSSPEFITNKRKVGTGDLTYVQLSLGMIATC